jgi:ferrochelatase
MRDDGIRHALAFVTSAYSSYSGCRQYREDIARARAAVGEGAPEVDKLRVFFNHPRFLDAVADRVEEALQAVPGGTRDSVQVVYTAHSIPTSMAQSSDYVQQLEEVRRIISERLNITNHVLTYQSRSGAPGQPWLGPDVLDHLREVKSGNLADSVVLAPIGFISDHMEVLYDLDVEARELADSLSLPMVRAKTVGVHPEFVGMIRELVLERMDAALPRLAAGSLGARADFCAEGCCPAPVRGGR